MLEPLVSIIIPTFNRAHIIRETLDSIKAQIYQNWECIIVDDCSVDNTVNIVESFSAKDSRFKYLKRPENIPKGANSCRNYGFGVSNGEFINWFDSDDIMLPDFLSKKIDYFKLEKYNLVICSGYLVDNKLNVLRESNYYDNGNIYKNYTLYKSEVFTPSVMIRKVFLKEKELFNLNITRGQETEFFNRIFFSLKLEDYIYTNDKLFLYRQHDDSITSFHNKEYLKENISSLVYTSSLNIDRGFILKDLEIINHVHRFLLYLLFLAIFQKDRESIQNIRAIFKTYPKKNYISLSLINIYILIGINTNLKIKTIEKRLKRNKIIF